jgi:hypothetical protein
MSDDLKNRLIREADATSPAFDESLHAKTMSRVNAARRAQLAASVQIDHPATTRLFIVSKLALGFFLVFFAVAWYVVPRNTPPITTADAKQFNEAIAELRQSTPPMDVPFALPMNKAKQQLVLLGEDANALGAFFVDQLNVLPAEDRGL